MLFSAVRSPDFTLDPYAKAGRGPVGPEICCRTTSLLRKPLEYLEMILAPKSAAEQQAYYENRWNTWRWRFLFKIFFSKTIMGRYGRDPEFLKEVEVSVGKAIYNKAGNHLRNPLAQRNFMLRYTLTASFGELLPHYLQPEHFPTVKANLDKLQLIQGYAEDAIRLYG